MVTAIHVLFFLLLLFVFIYFFLVPICCNGADYTKVIWTPWQRPGSCGHWNNDMQQCLQVMINKIKPNRHQAKKDPDLVRSTMNENNFYEFLKDALPSM